MNNAIDNNQSLVLDLEQHTEEIYTFSTFTAHFL